MTLRTFDSSEPVTSVMTKGVLYIEADRTVLDAVKILDDFDIGSLLVLENEKAVGIITTKDIVRAIAQGKRLDKTKVSEIMQSPVITISAFETIEKALIKMREQKINHLIVVEQGKIIGMINPLNLLAY